MYYANPCSEPLVEEAMRQGRIGFIATPKQGNQLIPGVATMFDNGCFTNGYPGDAAWLEWLANYGIEEWYRFAVAPDVVGDAEATLERALPLLRKIRGLGLRAAFVAQNGIENTVIPWDEFDVLFLGGSLECLSCQVVWPSDKKPGRNQACWLCGWRMTEWKEGVLAAQLTGQAKRRGKKVHMGRVNSERRFPVRRSDRRGLRGRHVSDVRAAHQSAGPVEVGRRASGASSSDPRGGLR